MTSAGEGRVASAARADYAEAAAVVLTEAGHEGQVYELAGDEAWTFDVLAEALAEVLGRDVELRQVSSEEHAAILEGVGLDAGTAGFVRHWTATSATATWPSPTAPCPGSSAGPPRRWSSALRADLA